MSEFNKNMGSPKTSRLEIKIPEGSLSIEPKHYAQRAGINEEGRNKIIISSKQSSADIQQIRKLEKTRESIDNISKVISVLSSGFKASISGRLIFFEGSNGEKPVIEFAVENSKKPEAIVENIKSFFKHDSLSEGYINPIVELPQSTTNNHSFKIDANKFPELKPSQLITMLKRVEEHQSYRFKQHVLGPSGEQEVRAARKEIMGMLTNGDNFPIKLGDGNKCR